MRKTFFVITLLGAIHAMWPVYAADFEAKITGLDGAPILDDKGKEVELTVRAVAVNALMTPFQDEQVSGEEKTRRAELARRISARDAAKLTAEDVALIKKLINKAYPSPLVVEQAWKAMERN